MTPQELYEIWAPPSSIWSAWAKPVLFAQMHMGKRKITEPTTTGERLPETLDGLIAQEQVTFEPMTTLDWVQSYRGDTALILDLPGETAVEAAMQLANQGFRPVPLYNCANSDVPVLVVPVERILLSLAHNAPLLGTFSLPPDAPPVFMLDSNRNPGLAPKPLEFDNRWVVFPQDFPSATFLQSHGLRRVVILQSKRAMMSPELQSDLYQVAQRWHTGGIEIVVVETQIPDVAQGRVPAFNELSYAAPSSPLMFNRLSRFRLGAMGVAAALFAVASRRSSGGGFGRIIPEPGSTGGG